MISGADGDDYLQGGPRRNRIAGGTGSDRIRLRGRGPNRVAGGPGDDTIEAMAQGAATIDCGAGRDTVRIGFNRRVKTRSCERVTKRYR